MTRTFTHTWTQTRLETVQDQFRFLLYYNDVDDDAIDNVLDALAERAISAVGIFGCKNAVRLIEVELRIDWVQNARLTLQVPTIHGGLPGWIDKQSPETRVAGRRFAEIVKKQGLTTGWWIELAPNVASVPKLQKSWNRRLGISGSAPPPWAGGQFEQRPESLLDLTEMEVIIKRTRQR